VVPAVASGDDLSDTYQVSPMIIQQWSVLAVILLAGSSLLLLLSQNWRLFIIGMAVQYLAVFWLVAINWPIGLAVVKLIVGWMVAAVLAASQSVEDIQYFDRSKGISGLLFRLIAALIVWVFVYSIAPALKSWISTNDVVLIGGLLLIGMGLLHLGMTTNLVRIMAGLLSTLAGFEILYASVEASVLVTGLLSVINIGLALGGSFLLAAQEVENPV
jgi:hypothetical protein